MSWIRFDESDSSPSGKTKTWKIRSKDTDFTVGVVSWYSHWRKYAFTPSGNSVFEQDCLREIADFCDTQTTLHKEAKRG